MNMRTNVGKEFLQLLISAFPPSNPLHKLFNWLSVKVSYKIMPNMAKAVASHNIKILKEDRPADQQQLPGRASQLPHQGQVPDQLCCV